MQIKQLHYIQTTKHVKNEFKKLIFTILLFKKKSNFSIKNILKKCNNITIQKQINLINYISIFMEEMDAGCY